MWRYYIGNLYLTTRWYLLMASAAGFFLMSFFLPALFTIAVAIFILAVALTVTDYLILFSHGRTIYAKRVTANRFSLGDENEVKLRLRSTFPFDASLVLIDELPMQFQQRNFQLNTRLKERNRETFTYALKPVLRGEYEFGELLCYVSSPLRLLQRRIHTAESSVVKVYPSFQQLKKYQLLAFSDNRQAGIKKIRRVGHSMEFEKIKSYVQGDDVRTINWKATARTGDIMVNTYTDSRQQQVYCLVDKGRSMKMPFEEMSLLDYSINASLALLNIALLKHDRAGLISFSNTVSDLVPAERRSNQLNSLMEGLYRQQTDFKESDYEGLWHTLHKRVTQRSLLVLFTNLETHAALERQLTYLKKNATRQ